MKRIAYMQLWNCIINSNFFKNCKLVGLFWWISLLSYKALQLNREKVSDVGTLNICIMTSSYPSPTDDSPLASDDDNNNSPCSPVIPFASSGTAMTSTVVGLGSSCLASPTLLDPPPKVTLSSRASAFTIAALMSDVSSPVQETGSRPSSFRHHSSTSSSYGTVISPLGMYATDKATFIVVSC